MIRRCSTVELGERMAYRKRGIGFADRLRVFPRHTFVRSVELANLSDHHSSIRQFDRHFQGFRNTCGSASLNTFCSRHRL